MGSKTKKILIGFLIVASAGSAVGVYYWNKKPVNPGDVKPTYVITASDLYKSFSTDSANAVKYIGDEKNQKVIRVDGEVKEVKITDSTANVFLKGSDDGGDINCEFREKAENIKQGDKISIKGLCSGYDFDADLGIPGTVIIKSCVLVK